VRAHEGTQRLLVADVDIERMGDESPTQVIEPDHSPPLVRKPPAI
jgi:hypothetical protein